MASTLLGDYEARCSFCGWTKSFMIHQSCGLKVGDVLFRTDDPVFNQCLSCKRTNLIVTSTPAPAELPKPKGFWQVPKS